VSSDLSRLFAALGAAADPRRLPDPRALRHAAERRTRTRRAAVAAIGVATALAAAVAVTLLRNAPRSEVPIGPVPSMAVAGSPSPSTIESPAPPPSPTARAAGSDCRPADLDPRPYYDGEGAAGTSISYVIVQNRGATACRLGTYPTLRYTDGGVVKPVPAQRIADRQAPVLLAPGRYAQLSVARPNCASTRAYQGLWVELTTGENFRLPAFRLPADCGLLQITPWTVSDFPGQVGVSPTRAP